MKWNSDFRHRLFRMVSVGVVDEPVNRAYDIISTLCLLCNLSAAILATYQGFQVKHGFLLREVERWTVLFFAIDYVLRLLTAKELYTGKTEKGALCAYILSFSGIIDLLSFLPYYLPIFFPSGAAVFRMFRVIRIFRLFRINNYYDSLNVITEVLESKRQQLLSSVFIICILMVASSLCMYSVEHNAQPQVFTDAFSGIWWAASTLLTVGYGDIYPITPLGKLLGIGITFLGVGMVAIPTGIISAGFVEQYQRLKRIGDYGGGSGIHFIHFFLEKKDVWCEKTIRELELPGGLRIVVLKRKNQVIVPRGDVRMHAGDELVLGAEALRDESPLDLTEVVLHEDHPWVGKEIRQLDLSRQTNIVLILRPIPSTGNQASKENLSPSGKKVLDERQARNGHLPSGEHRSVGQIRKMLPRGDSKLQCGDTVVLYHNDKRSFLEEHRF